MTMADRDGGRPEFNPKYRIVGAIVIVALLVIFVPMILNEREPPPELKGIKEIPASGEAAQTKVLVSPVEPEEPKVQGIIQTPPTAVSPPVTESAPTPEAQPAAPVEKAEPEKTPPVTATRENLPKPTAAAGKITKGWIVQVGTFTNIANATRLRDKLKSQGHKAYTEPATVAGKKALRLRVGPFHDKDQAVKEQARIRKQTGLKGAVQEYP